MKKRQVKRKTVIKGPFPALKDAARNTAFLKKEGGMSKKASKVINVEFAYTAMGILGKTLSNVTPTSFVVKGPLKE